MRREPRIRSGIIWVKICPEPTGCVGAGLVCARADPAISAVAAKPAANYIFSMVSILL
jgi:hypothetical protein